MEALVSPPAGRAEGVPRNKKLSSKSVRLRDKSKWEEMRRNRLGMGELDGVEAS